MYEREEVAAGASGRNSGSIQHPFDPVLAELHTETLIHYRGMDEVGMAGSPAGVLMLAPEHEPLEDAVREIGDDCPELEPGAARPGGRAGAGAGGGGRAVGVPARNGLPGPADRRTRAFARRAHAAGARFHEAETAWPWVARGRARGCSPQACGARRGR